MPLTTSTILSQPVQFVKRFLKFLFCLNSKHFPFRCLPVKASHLSYPVSLAATCIILQELRPFVNSYLELFSRFFNCSRCCPWIRKKHRLRDAHLHMAGVAGLEPAVQESESCALPLGDSPLFVRDFTRTRDRVIYFIKF